MDKKQNFSNFCGTALGVQNYFYFKKYLEGIRENYPVSNLHVEHINGTFFVKKLLTDEDMTQAELEAELQEYERLKVEFENNSDKHDKEDTEEIKIPKKSFLRRLFS